MKRIWLINHHVSPPDLSGCPRTIKFAQYLSHAGYDVTIFASSVVHNKDMNLITNGNLYVERQYDGLKFVHINTQQYNRNGLFRIIGLIQFIVRFFRVAKKFPSPNVIVHTALVPFGNPIYFYAHKVKAKYIVEILDLWPETFVELGIMRRSNPLMWLLYKMELWLYKRADELVFSMEGGSQYLHDRGWTIDEGGYIDLSHVHYINNGVDLTDFNFFLDTFRLEDKDLTDKSFKRVIYLGSIRKANHLKHLVDAAEILKNKPDIKFLIYGDGDDREELIKYCNDYHIDNIIFKEKWIDPKYVPYVLTCASVNILNYKQGDFGKYGGSQSKMFQYIASRKPICCNLEMMFCPITKNNLGIARNFLNPDEYAAAIYSLASLSENELVNLGNRSEFAISVFDSLYLTNQLIEVIEKD